MLHLEFGTRRYFKQCFALRLFLLCTFTSIAFLELHSLPVFAGVIFEPKGGKKRKVGMGLKSRQDLTVALSLTGRSGTVSRSMLRFYVEVT